ILWAGKCAVAYEQRRKIIWKAICRGNYSAADENNHQERTEMDFQCAKKEMARRNSHELCRL
ncbi:MAG: hypothetical protein K2H12_06275, partial [Acetatifactor sp.]|nr:hypothetical protein [Acetatifactor sp.]